jgi:hypothetical protein
MTSVPPAAGAPGAAGTQTLHSSRRANGDASAPANDGDAIER